MHICGQCNQEFETEEAYLEHKCEKTGFKPTEPQSMEYHESISKAALARGEARKQAKE